MIAFTIPVFLGSGARGLWDAVKVPIVFLPVISFPFTWSDKRTWIIHSLLPLQWAGWWMVILRSKVPSRHPMVGSGSNETHWGKHISHKPQWWWWRLLFFIRVRVPALLKCLYRKSQRESRQDNTELWGYFFLYQGTLKSQKLFDAKLWANGIL